MVTWSLSDVGRRDTRPGARINFITRARNLIAGGLTGTVAATVKAPWGPENQVRRVESLAEYESLYTFDGDLNEADYDGDFIVREIFNGGVSAVLVNRLVNSGQKAAGQIQAHVGALSTISVGAAGTGYSAGTDVVISQPGSNNDARGTVVVSSGGVTSIAVTTPGTGYVDGSVTIPGGTGGTFSGVVDKTGVSAVALEAKYSGVMGNNIRIVVETNGANPLRKDVTLTVRDSRDELIFTHTITTTYDNFSRLSKTWLAAQINRSPMGSYIEATATATDTAPINPSFLNGTIALAGGSDGADLTPSQYTAAMESLEQEKFESVYFNLNTGAAGNQTILGAVNNWVASERARGKMLVWYTGNPLHTGIVGDSADLAVMSANGYNNEGVVFVPAGYVGINSQGAQRTYAGWQFAARMAGLVAGLRLTESPTFASVGTGIIDLEKRYKNSDIKKLLGNGVMPVVYDGTRFKIERGINTFTTFTVEKGDIFSKLYPLRILDNMNNIIQVTVDEFIIGKNPNSIAGREDSIELVRSLLDRQAFDGYIEDNFVIREDPNIQSGGDDAFVQVGIEPIDSIEFMWFNVNLGGTQV